MQSGVATGLHNSAQEIRPYRSPCRVDRTIAFAALAGEAKIQRFMDVVLFLAAIKRIPLQRLPEHVRFP